MIRRLASAATLVLAGLAAVPAAAQSWSGEVGGGYVWQSVSGSEDSFRTQYGQDSGFLLESLRLAYAPSAGAPTSFEVKAWGFGGSEPDEHAALYYKPNGAWSFRLDYDRNNAFFRLADPAERWHRDDWHMDRWKGGVVFDGWSFARLSLDLRYTRRAGEVDRPLYGLNVFYPMRVDLDETLREGTLRFETKTLPVHILLEQSLATYERQNRWSPAGGGALNVSDPDLLAALATDRRDKQDVPTTRLAASYRNRRFEVAGNFLYSKSTMDVSGQSLKAFDIAGGGTGRIEYIDQLMGSANQDLRAANLAMGFDLGYGWSLRLAGDYRDTASDSNQQGERLLRIVSPLGFHLDFPLPVDESGRFEVEDRDTRIEIRKQGARWAVWAGGNTASRDVSWRLVKDDSPFGVKRTTSGYFLGGSYSPSRRLKLSGEYERGTFEKYIFRTDPETVDRLTLRLRSDLGHGWNLSARVRTEKGDNPNRIAGAGRTSDGYGFALGWEAADGRGGFGLDADKTRLKADTAIFLPQGTPSFSRYDLDLLTLSAYGHATLGKVGLSGTLSRLRDSGETWPFRSWAGRLEAALKGPKGTEFALFARYNQYDEIRTAVDNFDVTGYGLVVRWRF